jgi:hypothetical protein
LHIIMSGLLLGMSALVDSIIRLVTLRSGLVSANFGTCSYQRSLCNFTPISLHMLKCS